MPIILPKIPIPARRRNPKKIILYGPPKVGKTFFLNQLAGNFIVDLEKGTDYLDGINYQVNDLATFGEVGLQIKTENNPYPFVTIDTISKLEEWCEWEATELYMQSPIGVSFNKKMGRLLPRAEWESVLTLPNGAGYYWLRKSMMTWIERYATVAPTLIMVAHLKDKLVDKKDGKEVNAKDLDLTGRLKSIVASDADAIGYVYRNVEGELRISFQSSEEVTCGSRCDHLKGRDIAADWSLIFLPEEDLRVG